MSIHFGQLSPNTISFSYPTSGKTEPQKIALTVSTINEQPYLAVESSFGGGSITHFAPLRIDSEQVALNQKNACDVKIWQRDDFYEAIYVGVQGGHAYHLTDESTVQEPLIEARGRAMRLSDEQHDLEKMFIRDAWELKKRREQLD